MHRIVFTDKATGGSMDWVYGVKKVPLTFTFEFRDRRYGNTSGHTSNYAVISSIYPFNFRSFPGRYGFILPAEQIVPNCLEFLDGLKAMIAETRALKYF